MKLRIQIERHLPLVEEEWRGYAPGERFLTVAQLMKKFQVNRRVVDGILDRMAKKGQLHRIRRVGLFCCAQEQREGVRVLYACPDWNGKAQNCWKKSLDQYVQMHRRWKVATRLMNPDTENIAQLDTTGFDAAILMHTASTVTGEEMKFLAEQTIPVVVLGIVPGSFAVSTVNSDDTAAAATACRYLIDHGHRKLAVISGNFLHAISRKRLTAFQEMADRFGASCLLLDGGCQNGEHVPTKCAEMLDEFLGTLSGKLPFTAVYALSSSIVPMLTEKLRDYGYRVPQDVSIVGHGVYNEGAKFSPPLTEVCFDTDTEVAEVFAGLEELLSGQRKQLNTIVPIKLTERQSVIDIRLFKR